MCFAIQFMVADGLVAKPIKQFMVPNTNDRDTNRKKREGIAEIQQVKTARLLGVILNDNQK